MIFLQSKNSSITFLFVVYNGAGSCLNQMSACVSDKVCNKNLTPVLQARRADPCDRQRCQQATQHFYGSMPQNVAEMLAMCECEATDQNCLLMKTDLHSGMCGDETQICQDRVNQCVEDSNCRYVAILFVPTLCLTLQ